jgi:hypothetical protein
VGTGFRVDPEKAQACIDELTAVIRDLRFAVTAGSALAFAPPSQDPVSINVARNAGAMATRAQEWMLAWMAQLESTRNGLQHQLEAYRTQDSESALTL